MLVKISVIKQATKGDSIPIKDNYRPSTSIDDIRDTASDYMLMIKQGKGQDALKRLKALYKGIESLKNPIPEAKELCAEIKEFLDNNK